MGQGSTSLTPFHRHGLKYLLGDSSFVHISIEVYVNGQSPVNKIVFSSDIFR